MSVITITKDNFQTEVLESDKPVLLDFWVMVRPMPDDIPTINEIAEELRQSRSARSMSMKEPELAKAYNVMSIPTLVVIKTAKW